MDYPRMGYKVFNTPTGSGASMSKNLITVTGLPETIPYTDIISYTKTAYAAGIISQKTYTYASVTPAAREYTCAITQNNATKTYRFRALATYSTTQIRAGILAAILADPDAVVEDNTSATTDLKLKLKTANLNYGDFTVTHNDSTITETVDAAYVAPAGTYSIVSAIDSVNAVVGCNYTTYEILYKRMVVDGRMPGSYVYQTAEALIFAEATYIYYADFDSSMTALFGATQTIKFNGGVVGAYTATWIGNSTNVMYLAASLTAQTYTIPLNNLPVGAQITAFRIMGAMTSGGGTVTLDADLRKIKKDLTDASVGAITQISKTAGYTFDTEKGSLTETVAADYTYYVLATGTTAAGTTIKVIGIEVDIKNG